MKHLSLLLFFGFVMGQSVPAISQQPLPREIVEYQKNLTTMDDALLLQHF